MHVIPYDIAIQMTGLNITEEDWQFFKNFVEEHPREGSFFFPTKKNPCQKVFAFPISAFGYFSYFQLSCRILHHSRINNL